MFISDVPILLFRKNGRRNWYCRLTDLNIYAGLEKFKDKI